MYKKNRRNKKETQENVFWCLRSNAAGARQLYVQAEVTQKSKA